MIQRMVNYPEILQQKWTEILSFFPASAEPTKNMKNLSLKTAFIKLMIGKLTKTAETTKLRSE